MHRMVCSAPDPQDQSKIESAYARCASGSGEGGLGDGGGKGGAGDWGEGCGEGGEGVGGGVLDEWWTVSKGEGIGMLR